MNPYHVEVYADLARTYLLMGRPARQLHALAIARYASYDLAGAAALWDRSVALDPADPDAHYGRALVLGSLGRLAPASDELHLACALASAQACASLASGARGLPSP